MSVLSFPLVTVIMPCFKMGRFVGEALKSVGTQTYPHWEIIVVDDCGPEDGTRAAVADFAGKFPDRRVEYLRQDQNRGVSVARNRAISAAKGELLAFLDPDDGWDAGYLKQSATLFAGDPELVVTACPARIVKGDEGEPTSETEFFKPWEQAMFPHIMGVRNGFATSGVMIRRSAVSQAKVFDEAPEIQHAEDWDLWLRLVEQGVKFHLHTQPACFYRKHPNAATAQQAAMIKRAQAVIKKHERLISALQPIVLGGMAWKIGQLEAAIYQAQPTREDLISRIYRKVRSQFRS